MNLCKSQGFPQNQRKSPDFSGNPTKTVPKLNSSLDFASRTENENTTNSCSNYMSIPENVSPKQWKREHKSKTRGMMQIFNEFT